MSNPTTQQEFLGRFQSAGGVRDTKSRSNNGVRLREACVRCRRVRLSFKLSFKLRQATMDGLQGAFG